MRSAVRHPADAFPYSRVRSGADHSVLPDIKICRSQQHTLSGILRIQHRHVITASSWPGRNRFIPRPHGIVVGRQKHFCAETLQKREALLSGGLRYCRQQPCRRSLISLFLQNTLNHCGSVIINSQPFPKDQSVFCLKANFLTLTTSKCILTFTGCSSTFPGFSGVYIVSAD